MHSHDSHLGVSGFLCVSALMSDKSRAMFKDLFFELDRHAVRLQQSCYPTPITSVYKSGLVKLIAEKVNVFFRVFLVISIMPFSFFMLTVVVIDSTSP